LIPGCKSLLSLFLQTIIHLSISDHHWSWKTVEGPPRWRRADPLLVAADFYKKGIYFSFLDEKRFGWKKPA
jgi:hypothetical protein